MATDQQEIVAPMTPTTGLNLNPQGVFSTSNITQASTNPATRPDDLLGIRNQIYGELGIPGLNTQYQNLYNQINQFDQATNTGLVGLEGQQVALNVIRGEQAQLERNRALSREGIAREMQVAQNALVAAQQEAQQRYAIREQQVNLMRQLILENPGAKLTFGDSIESAASKIKKYQDKLRKEEEKRRKKAEEKALKNEYKYWKKKTDYSSEISYKEWLKKGGNKSSEKETKLDFSNKGLSSMIDEEYNSGTDWEQIAQKLEAAKPGITKSGGSADKYLQYKFGTTKKNPFK